MKVRADSVVKLCRFKLRPEGGGFIVENVDRGDFYEMNASAAAGLEWLSGGLPVGEVECRLRLRYPAEPIHVAEFVEELCRLGLVEEVDGETLPGGQPASRLQGGMLWISPRWGRLFLGGGYRLAMLGCLGLTGLLLAVMPDLRPAYSDLFVLDSFALNMLIWMSAGTVLLFVHEWGHIAAARAHGLPVRLQIGHRLIFPVLETDLTAAWRLEPKSRNALFLAGICVDLLLLGAALTVQLLFGPGLALSLLKLTSVILMLNVLFQCGIFMKTDLYYVIQNVSGCYNLMELGHAWLRGVITRKPGRAGWERRELAAARLYAVLYAAGLAAFAAVMLLYMLPIAYLALKLAIQGMSGKSGAGAFWDGAALFIQAAVMLALLAYSAARSRKERNAGESSGRFP